MLKSALVHLKTFIKNNRKFLVYSAIGVTGVTINYIVFFVLVKILGVYYQLANLFSVSLGITNNFIWNAKINFKVKNKLKRRFAQFYTVGLCGYFLSSFLLYLFYEKLHMEIMLSKISTLFFVVILQYFLNSRFAFGRKDDVSR